MGFLWRDVRLSNGFNVLDFNMSQEEEEEETLFVNGIYNYIVWVQSSTIKQ